MTISRTRVKFCGMAHPQDIDAAIELGVDALGFIFAPSPRRLSLAVAETLVARVPALVATVAVFVDPDDELYAAVARVMPRMLPQFCGAETPERCAQLARGAYFKVFHIDDASSERDTIPQQVARYPNALPVFDTKVAGRGGGGGIAFDWSILPPKPLRAVIAGGLNPENVTECIRTTKPFAVDVRSGIELDGRKDYHKMAAFLAAVREGDKEQEHSEA